MNSSIRRELVRRAAAKAEYVRIKNGVKPTAAVDPILLAKKEDCEVRFMSLPSLEGVYSPNPGPIIILGSQRPAGRRAFTCAHELGHHKFKHGYRIDEINSGRVGETKDPDEFLADMFAALLLISQASVRRAIKDRNVSTRRVTPIQIFQIASYLGVGYSTLIEHLSWTLKLISPAQRKNLLRTQPKEIKTLYGGNPLSEVVFVDELWRDRAVDLEVGDILVIPRSIMLENTPRLVQKGIMEGMKTYKAERRGQARAFHEKGDWAVNIRIAPDQYEGIAQFRFLDDPEEVNNGSG